MIPKNQKFLIGVLIVTICFTGAGRVFTQSLKSPLESLKTASQPSRLFSIPTGDILQSMEVSFSGGGAFGIEGGTALLRNLIFGLGGIAEVELTTSGMTNRLTGKSERVPTSSFKVSLIPERFKGLWYLPDIAVQLRSASWQSLEGENSQLRYEYKAYSAEMDGNLHAVSQLQKRFSILYLIIGKRIPSLGSIHLGVSQTDIRTKGGFQTIYLPHEGIFDTIEIQELQESFISPFGGLEILANNTTRLMAELHSVPLFDYDFKNKEIEITQTWLGVAGIRFFLAPWISLDTGVKYQSDFDGIADAEIDIGVNFVIPVKNIISK